MPTFAIPNGAVAQMVEQWTENPCVGSSILPVQSEAVLRQIKYVDGCNRFRYRGSILTSAEFATV